jgi:glycosyltransferase involved in cell wall biosynthesis
VTLPKNPTVSVIMPVFNAGRYLRYSVLSIMKQTFFDWELIIIDDGSEDNAIESISDLKDPRIKIINGGVNKGLAFRLNECIRTSRGRYIARMDQDDISHPRRIESQLKFLESCKDIDLVATKALMIDHHDKIIGIMPSRLNHEDICHSPWNGFYLPHPTWMGRISWFRKFGYLEPGPYFCEDQELLLRSYHLSRFACLDECLLAYRVRSKINLFKNLKIHFTLFNLQKVSFARQRQWKFLFLAFFNLQMSFIKDLFLLVLGVAYINMLGFKKVPSKNIENDFKKILHQKS